VLNSIRNGSTAETIYDISVPVRPDMPLYPGSPPVEYRQVSSTAAGSSVNMFQICMGTHVGTHVDAPFHVDEKLSRLDQIDLKTLVGPCQVIELSVGVAIMPEDLRNVSWGRAERLLFKTRNSKLWDGPFQNDFAYLSVEAAQLISAHPNVRLVGIDYLSIDKTGSNGLEAHHILLSHNIVIVEGINLQNVPAGSYQLTCLPLNITTGDGAPARAILQG
jgi:arylformamidase